MPILEAIDVNHRYTTSAGEVVTALTEVNLSIEVGELVVIVGPSGCGKSTLLNLFAGLVNPSSGQLKHNGSPIRGPGRERGVVFQDHAVMPWRNVLRNVTHGPEIAGVPKPERVERARELLAAVGLSGFERKYPHELSGGMRQRVAVARTWANDPDVILMDEPFASVDAMTRLTLQEQLLELVEATQKTVIFITHSVDEAVFLADRVITMSPRPGRIVDVLSIDRPRSERNWEQTKQDPVMQAAMGHVLNQVRGGDDRGT